MKKKQFMVIFASFFSCFSISYAGVESCTKDAVHCAYVTGLSDSVYDARYIKLYNSKMGSFVLCFNNRGMVEMTEGGAKAHVGQNTDIYSICADENGSQCEEIGKDTYEVSTSQRRFMSKPRYYVIDLSNIKGRYPQCEAGIEPVMFRNL